MSASSQCTRCASHVHGDLGQAAPPERRSLARLADRRRLRLVMSGRQPGWSEGARVNPPCSARTTSAARRPAGLLCRRGPFRGGTRAWCRPLGRYNALAPSERLLGSRSNHGRLPRTARQGPARLRRFKMRWRLRRGRCQRLTESRRGEGRSGPLPAFPADQMTALAPRSACSWAAAKRAAPSLVTWHSGWWNVDGSCVRAVAHPGARERQPLLPRQAVKDPTAPSAGVARVEQLVRFENGPAGWSDRWPAGTGGLANRARLCLIARWSPGPSIPGGAAARKGKLHGLSRRRRPALPARRWPCPAGR
jgi:hypothetical protein